MVKVSQVNSVHCKYWTCILKQREYIKIYEIFEILSIDKVILNHINYFCYYITQLKSKYRLLNKFTKS